MREKGLKNRVKDSAPVRSVRAHSVRLRAYSGSRPSSGRRRIRSARAARVRSGQRRPNPDKTRRGLLKARFTRLRRIRSVRSKTSTARIHSGLHRIRSRKTHSVRIRVLSVRLPILSDKARDRSSLRSVRRKAPSVRLLPVLRRLRRDPARRSAPDLLQAAEATS